jgi:hypothetical protein
MPSATFLTKVSCFWVNGLCCFAMTVKITTIRRRRPDRRLLLRAGDAWLLSEQASLGELALMG